MKAKLLIFAVTAVMMAFTACIKERIVYVEKESPTSGIELQPGEGIVKISLAEGMSRAARPVVSFESTSDINTIAFKFYKFNNYTVDNSGKVVAAYSDAEGENSIGSVKDNIITFENGLKDIRTLYIKIQNLEEAGEYHIFAYGYNKGENEDDISVERSGECLKYTVPTEYQNLNTDNDDAVIKRINHIDQEIFAGYVQTETNKHGLLNKEVSIELTRQVAGLLAYLSDVPAYVLDSETNKNIRVYKITIETGLKGISGIYFPAINLVDDNKNEDNKYFNGFVGNGGDFAQAPLLTFDLSDLDDPGIGNTYDFSGEEGKKYLLAEEMKGINLPSGFTCEDNTLFGSCFLCPFNGHQSFIRNDLPTNFATLNIVYYDESGQRILSVPLRTAVPPTTPVATQVSENDYSGLSYQYDIRCNNFYSIGTKGTTGDDGDSGSGGTPDEPLPIDPVSGIDRFNLTIDVEWTQIHDITNK